MERDEEREEEREFLLKNELNFGSPLAASRLPLKHGSPDIEYYEALSILSRAIERESSDFASTRKGFLSNRSLLS